MDWLIIAVVVWCVIALPVGIVIGKGIKLADRRVARPEPRCRCGTDFCVCAIHG